MSASKPVTAEHRCFSTHSSDFPVAEIQNPVNVLVATSRSGKSQGEQLLRKRCLHRAAGASDGTCCCQDRGDTRAFLNGSAFQRRCVWFLRGERSPLPTRTVSSTSICLSGDLNRQPAGSFVRRVKLLLPSGQQPEAALPGLVPQSTPRWTGPFSQRVPG